MPSMPGSSRSLDPPILHLVRELGVGSVQHVAARRHLLTIRRRPASFRADFKFEVSLRELRIVEDRYQATNMTSLTCPKCISYDEMHSIWRKMGGRHFGFGAPGSALLENVGMGTFWSQFFINLPKCVQNVTNILGTFWATFGYVLM